MGVLLAEASGEAKSVFDDVSAAVDRDILALCRDSDEDTLRLTQNAQIALFTCGLAAWAALQEAWGGEAQFFAGHSVGEYAAVVASGALSIEEGARLIQRRGELMAQAQSGAMAAILGMDAPELDAVLTGVNGTVVLANDNCPGQLVISGTPEAVAEAGQAALAAGAKRALPLNVSGAFHSPLMADAGAAMRESLGAVNWVEQHTPVAANVTGQLVRESHQWADLLGRQLESSVRWTDSIRTMIGAGARTFIECGAGEVLTGMLKRIDREPKGYAVQDPESLNSLLTQL